MQIVSQTKAWLRLFRAHTAILEAPMAVVGAAIGLGTLYDPRVGYWLFFGVLYHFVGYGMNSYADWKKGFDKDDPRKQHHPLNTGEITPDQAKIAVWSSTVLLILTGIVLGGLNAQAVGITVLMLVLGVTYNYAGKYTRFKVLPIAAVHTLVFIFPYVTYVDGIGLYGILIASAYFVHHVYQIAISGDIKDIDQDEASLLATLGAYVEDHPISDTIVFMSSQKALLIGYLLTVIEILLAFGSIFSLQQSIYIISVAGVLGAVVMYDTDNMLQPGPFMRSKRLKYISRRELAGYSMIHSASISIIGFIGFGAMLASMLLYLGIVSKFIWGNWLVPEV